LQGFRSQRAVHHTPGLFALEQSGVFENLQMLGKAGSDMSNGSANSLTGILPLHNAARMPRRVGSDSAEKPSPMLAAHT